jgi:hypothetical protein
LFGAFQLCQAVNPAITGAAGTGSRYKAGKNGCITAHRKNIMIPLILFIRKHAVRATVNCLVLKKLYTWKDRAFEGSRRSCKRFSMANSLASPVYRSIVKERKLSSFLPFKERGLFAFKKKAWKKRLCFRHCKSFCQGRGKLKRR